MAVVPPPWEGDVVIGTGSEAIKLAPVIKAMRDRSDEFAVPVATSGQHGKICTSGHVTHVNTHSKWADSGGRMGWDSNPRRACTLAGFQDRCLKPLGHPSKGSISTKW
jgi:hypothetical protein